MMDSRTHLLRLFFILALLTTAVVGDADGDDDADADGDDDAEGDMGTVIGIDLGTTYSCVAIFKQGRAEVIVNAQGHRVTPSYVAFTLDDELLVGDAAKNQMISNPENTIFDVKRLIGRFWSDKNVQHDIPFYPFKVVNKGNKPYVQVNIKGQEKTFAPEEISAMVLGKMREVAEAYLGKKVTHAVVTVPAYFNNGQRQATKDAGTIAGLNITKIINEPTAAAIAYGLNKREGKHNILVFDLGGGTFDVSLLTINNGAFRVRATNGDTHLGGQDFDHRVMDHFIQLHQKKTGKNIRENRKALQKLRREVEKAKLMLSFQQQVLVEVDALSDGEDFSERLTRAKFEELNMDLFKSLMNPVKQVLEDAEMKKEEMDEIVLVGGSTRIPKVQQLVQEFFDGKEPSRGINPDEAVAEGAAVQAGILDKDEDTGDMVLVDVNPLTLGTMVEGGVMSVLIPRNTVLPTKKSGPYTTSRDNQQSIAVPVYEGERSMAEDNHFLGKFDLAGILPAPRGVPQLEITFEVDLDGILHVTAVDKGTGNTNSIAIEKDQAALSQKEIERMLQDAERYADKDRKMRERVDAKNQLETYVYNLRNQVNDKKTLGSKLNKNDKESILEVVKNAIAWVDENQEGSAGEFREKQKEVETIVQPIIRKLYGRDEL